MTLVFKASTGDNHIGHSETHSSTNMSLIHNFVYNASPARVIFGAGSSQKLPQEMMRQNFESPLIISTPDQQHLATKIKDILQGKIAGIFDQAKMHTPVEVTENAMQYISTINADSIISIGGGTAIGLGKAVSIRTGLPHVCIPTTYAGSEMTPILGETKDGQKTTRSDAQILPETVIYDVDYTMTLPPGLSVTSGINAIAHAGTRWPHEGNDPIFGAC